jgi:hypothetical protein
MTFRFPLETSNLGRKTMLVRILLPVNPGVKGEMGKDEVIREKRLNRVLGRAPTEGINQANRVWITGYSEVERGRSKRAINRLFGNRILRGSESGNIVPGAFTPVLAKH